jgi:hypothetical protein
MAAPHPLMTGGRSIRYLRAEVQAIQAILAGRPLTAEQVAGLRERLLDGAL